MYNFINKYHLIEFIFTFETYMQVVVKGMVKAEMILKIVMSPIESASDFVKQCRMRLPNLQSSEFQKILDMKVIIIHLSFD